jgi:acyl-CoA synthetase (AMP-forming)/AMP-acid ligase II
MPSPFPPALEDGPRRLHDLLDVIAADRPDRLAAADGAGRLSYGQLKSAVDGYARALLALGVRRGDRVAMLTPPCLAFWIALQATASIGAVWVGINPRYRERDFEHLLSDAKPRVLIVVSPFDGRDYRAELQPLLTADTAVVVHEPGDDGAIPWTLKASVGARAAVDLDVARAAVDAEDTALIVYTSGTTGRPKGAMLSHRAVTLSARANAAWMGSEALARAVCAAPVNHVGAINNICMNVLAGGGAVFFHPRVDMAALAALSRREKPTYLVSSPTGFAMMLESGGGVERLSDLRLIVFGGAATAQTVLEQIKPCGARLSSVYGQTETCGIITHTRGDATLEAMAATIGEPLEGAELRLADGHEQVVADGEIGEIQIRAPFLMSGYFQNASATRDAFTADGFLRTGDLGLRRPSGEVVFSGRLKEMFKSGGYNVYPVEVEQAICEHPGVALAAVVPVDHPTFQEVGHAFVQPAPGSVVSDDELAAFLRARIANYKVPKRFIIDAALPTLPNGKVDKLALKARAAEASG